MKLAYTGFSRSGQSVSDFIEAATAGEGTEKLRRTGIYVTDIRAADDTVSPAAAGKSSRRSAFGKGKRLKNVAMFLRQLHVLVVTGTPLAEALMTLEKQAGDAHFKGVVSAVRGKVEQGSALSHAMEDFPEYFNPICRGLISAGESGGKLGEMLERLADLTRKQVHVRGSVCGAMIYPALLTVVAIAVLLTLLVFVLPRFSALFASLDTPLPPTTKFLMLLSALIRTYWWALPIVFGGLGVSIWAFLNTAAGRRRIDWLAIRAPQFGPIVRNFETARLTRLLGILMQGRVPLLEALSMTKQASGNSLYADLLASAEQAISRGESLAGALGDPSLVAPSVSEAVRSGEKSGQLGPLLNTLADFLDEENEVTLRSLTSVIEPIILIVLGVLVGFIAISMFMPLFDLTSATGAR
jgi:type II secretory pathway component PulF